MSVVALEKLCDRDPRREADSRANWANSAACEDAAPPRQSAINRPNRARFRPRTTIRRKVAIRIYSILESDVREEKEKVLFWRPSAPNHPMLTCQQGILSKLSWARLRKSVSALPGGLTKIGRESSIRRGCSTANSIRWTFLRDALTPWRSTLRFMDTSSLTWPSFGFAPPRR